MTENSRYSDRSPAIHWFQAFNEAGGHSGSVESLVARLYNYATIGPTESPGQMDLPSSGGDASDNANWSGQ
jgi:hypothetical protein